jgi:hypothetical protein
MSEVSEPIDIPENVFIKFKPEQLLALSNLPIKVGNNIFVVQSVSEKTSLKDQKMQSLNI